MSLSMASFVMYTGAALSLWDPALAAPSANDDEANGLAHPACEGRRSQHAEAPVRGLLLADKPWHPGATAGSHARHRRPMRAERVSAESAAVAAARAPPMPIRCDQASPVSGFPEAAPLGRAP